MQLTREQHGNYLVIKANGRLDSSWAAYFTGAFLELIRDGHHHLVIDAGEMSYLSSAGIRSLLGIYKELKSVRGSFRIINAPFPVAKTLEMTGFKHWLSDEWPEETKSPGGKRPENARVETGTFILDPSAKLSFSVVADWEPWQSIEQRMMQRMSFPPSVFALGIGGAADQPGKALECLGDFLATGGHVIFQSPEEKTRPDFLLAEKEFVPDLLVIQALRCQGEMSHLIRFAPDDSTAFHGISQLAGQVLETTKSEAAGFVLMAEVDGLVGANLIRSPGLKSPPGEISYPEIREWLSFCGERAYSGCQALIFGIIARTDGFWNNGLIRPLPSNPGLSGHFHAAVFPYQPLQNGKIDMLQNIRKLLNGPPPQALLHLVDDDRPAVGLGQSSFIRGACWCSAMITGREEIL
jgi:anti-anti-sigma factor